MTILSIFILMFTIILYLIYSESKIMTQHNKACKVVYNPADHKIDLFTVPIVKYDLIRKR